MKKESNTIEIDLDKLSTLEITPTQYILAHCIYHNNKEEFNRIKDLYKLDCFKEDIFHLILKGYLTGGNPKNRYAINFEKSSIIGIFTKEENPIEESEDVLTWEQFVKEFRETFPAGQKSGGFYVRSSERDISNKLKKFVKEYKFSQDTILEATQCYVEESARRGYLYMKVANYFIYKDNTSMLAGACEALEEGGEDSSGKMSKMFNDNF